MRTFTLAIRTLIFSTMMLLLFTNNSRAQFDANRLWPDGIVYYEFEQGVNHVERNTMYAAMEEWERVADVDFFECPDNDCDLAPGVNYVQIGSFLATDPTPVGMQGGQQILDIEEWDKWNLVRELGHTLGFGNTNNRYDRNDYIRIEMDVIQLGYQSRFNIRASDQVYPTSNYGLADSLTYDFDSIMHFEACKYYKYPECCGIHGSQCIGDPRIPRSSIVVLGDNDNWQHRIGQKDHLSRLDSLTMSFLYPEDGWIFVDQLNGPAPGYSSGSFLSPHQGIAVGAASVPENGTVWVQPGAYNETITISSGMTIQAPLGAVSIGTSQSPNASGGGSGAAQFAQAGKTVNIVSGETGNKPEGFNLEQNYPNPFNPSTTIEYALQEDVHTSLKIYNMVGQEVRTLVNENQSSGKQSVVWDGRDQFGEPVSSGMYIYRLVAGGYVQTRKMMLLK